MPFEKVLIGGGSGFIGKHISRQLEKKGTHVTIISRSNPSGKPNVITWKQIEQQGIPPCDGIIQVTGANIMERRWTEERKRELLDSRVGLTRLLVNSLWNSKHLPKSVVCGSAVGYYPMDNGEYDESYSGKPGGGFAGYLVSEWEKSTEPLKKLPIKTATVRTALSLGTDGGAFPQLLQMFKWGLGGKVASGEQYMPWIHVEDIAGIFIHALENNNVNGVLNGVAPQVVTNKEFTKTLGKVLHRWTPFTVPKFAIDMMLQERADLVTKGHKIIPNATLQSGYQYQYDNLERALRQLLGK